MQEIRLTIRKRAFPSQGRVRLNVAHLPVLGIREGDRIDLVNEATQKTTTTTVIADTMVPEGQIRVSGEDLAVIGLPDGGEVLARRTPPLEEKIRQAAAGANTAFSKGVDELDEQVKKASGKIRAGAAKTAGTVKKTVEKATGPDDTL